MTGPLGLHSTTTNPNTEGQIVYNSDYNCMVTYNGTKVYGFSEWANYVASSAVNQTGVGSSTPITNDALGADSRSKLRYFTSLYDPTANKIKPNTDAGLDDTMFLKTGFDVVTTSPNTSILIQLQAYDSTDTPIFAETLFNSTIAAAGTTKVDRLTEIYWGPAINVGGYFKILYTSSSSISINNKAWRLHYFHL